MMNPLAAGRAFCWVKRHHPREQAAMAHALYDAYWARGLDLSTPQAIAAQVRLPQVSRPMHCWAALAGDEPATLLRESVAASLAAGVFGSPTVVVDGEPFWGVERLPDVDEWLARGGW
jgi:2-hydroxychromene-2-carboxylate isomerase